MGKWLLKIRNKTKTKKKKNQRRLPKYFIALVGLILKYSSVDNLKFVFLNVFGKCDNPDWPQSWVSALIYYLPKKLGYQLNKVESI